jgi:SHS2 domain-containing protein
LSAEASFEFVEGATSDLSFVARAPTLDALFAASAEALLAATVEDPAGVGAAERRFLLLDEPDLELLLLRFLNELVYLRDAEDLLLRPQRVRVSRGLPERLEAELDGERIRPERHRLAAEVKAATAHGLRVARAGEDADEAWEAAITLDV